MLREAARVLLVDESGAVLLMGMANDVTGIRFWFPPGGGIEAGEYARDAARREVAEETGLRDVVIGPELWRRRHVFTFNGVDYDQRERCFLARVTRFDPDGAAMTAQEKRDVVGMRWWTVDELEATEDSLAPSDLANLLRGLLEHGPPPVPMEVGV